VVEISELAGPISAARLTHLNRINAARKGTRFRFATARVTVFPLFFFFFFFLGAQERAGNCVRRASCDGLLAPRLLIIPFARRRGLRFGASQSAHVGITLRVHRGRVGWNLSRESDYGGMDDGRKGRESRILHFIFTVRGRRAGKLDDLSSGDGKRARTGARDYVVGCCWLASPLGSFRETNTRGYNVTVLQRCNCHVNGIGARGNVIAKRPMMRCSLGDQVKQRSVSSRVRSASARLLTLVPIY